METRRTTSSKLTLTSVARIALGGIFCLSALNGIFGLIPLPPDGPGGALITTLAATGYFFPLLRAVELTAAALLLSGALVPLGLVLAAPLVVGVASFHLFLAPAGLPVAVLLLACELLLAWRHREHFRPLFGAASAAPEPELTSAAVIGGAR